RLVAMSKRLRANQNLDRIPEDARAINELAAKIPQLFPPGSTQYPTAAKAAIWQDLADFTEKAKTLTVEAKKLTATNISDAKTVRDQFRAVAYACDDCHEKYRMNKRSQ
ncbi:MAG: c-type cytochrome, partial [bacterium]